MPATAARSSKAEKTLLDGIAANPKNRELKLAYVDLETARRSRSRARRRCAISSRRIRRISTCGSRWARILERTEQDRTTRAGLHRSWTRRASARRASPRARVATLDVRKGDETDDARKLIDEVLAKNPRDTDALILRGNLAR